MVLTFAFTNIMRDHAGTVASHDTILTGLCCTQFGTTFAAPVKRQGRVTEGVWVQSTQQDDLNVIVLDVEGTGGKERAANPDMDRQLGLLALNAADVVMLNINNVLVESEETMMLFRVIFQVTMIPVSNIVFSYEFPHAGRAALLSAIVTPSSCWLCNVFKLLLTVHCTAACMPCIKRQLPAMRMVLTVKACAHVSIGKAQTGSTTNKWYSAPAHDTLHCCARHCTSRPAR